MIAKWLNLDILYKGITLSLIYTTLALIISLIIFAATKDSSWLFGALFAIIAIYFTYFLIWIVFIITSKNNSKISVVASVIGWSMRVIIFTLIFTLSIFVIAPSVEGTGAFDVRNIFHPLNSIWMLFVYLIPTYAYLSVPFVEWLLTKIEKNK